MKSKLLDSFLVVKDQDLRKSLYPISSAQHDRRFTKFVRHRNSGTTVVNKGTEDNDGAYINFNPNYKQQTKPLTLAQILPRYHDQSFVAKSRELTNREKFLSLWSSLIKTVLLQKQSQRIFKKDSNVLLVWNFLVLYAYLFNIFQIPIAMFFTSAVYEDEFHTLPGLMLNWLAISIILINIVIVRPNTEFQNLGYLISNRKEIMQNYAGIKCILDLFGLLTLLIYALSYNHQLVFLKLFFYVDISTIFEIDDIIIDKIELKTFRYATYKLIRLLTFMLFILVWLSAIYFFIDYRFYVNETYNITENWLTWSMCAFQVNSEGQSVGTDIIQQYPGAWYIWLNYAIYWALQTISTVGYGDITPRNPVSVVFTNISILIMMFFFVFFLNSVIEIIDEMTSSEEKQKKSNIKKFKLYYKNAKQKLDEISLKYNYSPEEIERSKIELENTSNNIRSYLYEMDINNLLEEEENVEHLVNRNLTPELRDELFINYRQLFFKKVLLFGEIAKISDQFMSLYQKLIYKIKEVSYGRNEVVFARGERTSNSLFYLLKGSLSLQYPHSNYQKLITFTPNPSEQLNNSDTMFFNFGVREFVTRQEKDHNAITLSYCKIQKLEYEDFISIIKESKDFYYKFCELRDTTQIDQINSFTGQECLECSSKKHHIWNCDKCLFNLRFQIENEWQNSYRISVRQNSPAVNPRVPFYYRDRIATQRVSPKNMIMRRCLPDDTVLNSKFYKPLRNILIFKSKSESE